MSAPARTARPATDVRAQARRRRLKRVLVAVLLGAVLAAYTYGALDVTAGAEPRIDFLPQWAEALLLGAAFAVASLPVGWAILGRLLIPIPTLFLYLSIFLGRNPPLPFTVAFLLAFVYAGALTTLSVYLGDRPDRARLGSRR